MSIPRVAAVSAVALNRRTSLSFMNQELQFSPSSLSPKVVLPPTTVRMGQLNSHPQSSFLSEDEQRPDLQPLLAPASEHTSPPVSPTRTNSSAPSTPDSRRMLLPGPADIRGGQGWRRGRFALPVLSAESSYAAAFPIARNAVILRLGTLVTIFGGWLFVLYQMGHNLPDYEEEIHLPKNFDDVKSQSVILQNYSNAHFVPVLTLFTAVYIFKQTFSIPGSALMNILGGLLYGFWAFVFVSLFTAIGSTLCYLISEIVVGEMVVERFARSKLGYLRRRVEINRESGNLFYYLLFLRLFPFSPNWFLNIASPFVGVPVLPFFLSIFFGLMPYNYICVQAAATLAQLDSFADILSAEVLLKLLSMSVLALIPALYGQKIAAWIRGRVQEEEVKEGQA